DHVVRRIRADRVRPLAQPPQAGEREPSLGRGQPFEPAPAPLLDLLPIVGAHSSCHSLSGVIGLPDSVPSGLWERRAVRAMTTRDMSAARRTAIAETAIVFSVITWGFG